MCLFIDCLFHLVSSLHLLFSYTQISKDIANGREIGIEFLLKIQDMKNTNSVSGGKRHKDFLSVVIPYGIFREKEGLISVPATVASIPSSSSQASVPGSSSSPVSSGNTKNVTKSNSKASPTFSTPAKDTVVRRSASSMTICSNMHHLSFKVSPQGEFSILTAILFSFFFLVLCLHFLLSIPSCICSAFLLKRESQRAL